MRLILLTAGGRAGSDFFHSLLDGHSQILQFPGTFRVDNKLKINFKTEDLKKKQNYLYSFILNFLIQKLINLKDGIDWEKENKVNLELIKKNLLIIFIN